MQREKSGQNIKKVIIPVAGLGTRFLPATKAQPKEMLPIIDKPVIQFLVEEARDSGVEDVIFVTGRGKRAIEDHFDFSPELESTLISQKKTEAFKEVRKISDLAKIFYVRQNEPRGDGDAVLCAKHLLGESEAVGVLFGDDIVASKEPCLKQAIKVFEKVKSTVVALDTVPEAEVSKYGVVKAKKIGENLYQILGIVEKPEAKKAPSNMVFAGKYIITKEVFDELERLKKTKKDGELRLSEALKNVLKKKPVYGFLIEGKRYDCGSKIGFLQATVDFALKHSEVKDQFKDYLKKKAGEI